MDSANTLLTTAPAYRDLAHGAVAARRTHIPSRHCAASGWRSTAQLAQYQQSTQIGNPPRSKMIVEPKLHTAISALDGQASHATGRLVRSSCISMALH